jgi:hypothetical protein
MVAVGVGMGHSGGIADGVRKVPGSRPAFTDSLVPVGMCAGPEVGFIAMERSVLSWDWLPEV